MQRATRTAALVLAIAAVGVVAAAEGIARPSQGGELVLDVQLAFDTTQTMAPSIEAAQREATAIVQRIKQVSPSARFSVVAFRDPGYDVPEYELVQRFTAETAQVQAALGKLRIGTSQSATNTSAEAYNLVFRRSYADNAAGWRSGSRKLVVVIGDAEPHGAAASGVRGCGDTTADPHRLRTSQELARMRAAKRTLVLIRQATASATASLGCYVALADRAFPGGAALDGGAANLADRIVDLVRGAVVPVRVTADAGAAPAKRIDGYTVTLTNPNSLPLTVASLVVTLPPGFVYRGSVTGRLGRPQVAGSALTWRLSGPLAPGQVRRAHFLVRAGGSGMRIAVARADARLPDGTPIVANSRSGVRVAPPRRLSFFGTGRAPQTSISAGLQLRGGLSSGRAVGTATVTPGGGRRVVVRFDRYSVRGYASPARFVLTGRVVSARRLSGCRAGTPATLDVLDSNRLLRDERTSDRLTLRVGGGCRAAAGGWRNLRRTSAAVALTAR